MRSPFQNVDEKLASELGRDVALDIFARMSMVRHFESGVISAVAVKRIKCFVYLSTGEESVASALSLSVRDYMIFAQHRSHDVFLTFGGDPSKLRDELLGLPSGTSGGRAGSNCIQCHENGVIMFGHHGLIGENVPQAVGAALGSGKNTLAIFGDGAAEEDYVLSAIGFAVTHKLPVLFVCLDNDLSILTKVKTRRSWSMMDIARGFGMPAEDVGDDPWTILNKVNTLKTNLPALINCHVCRWYWHVGVGNDGPPEWDRYKLVKDKISSLGWENQMNMIDQKIKTDMERLWETSL